MTIAQIKAKAASLGIEPGGFRKAELIVAIQKAEGNTPCYGTMQNGCPFVDCAWSRDCATTAVGATAA
jgi:hypothetical protein